MRTTSFFILLIGSFTLVSCTKTKRELVFDPEVRSRFEAFITEVEEISIDFDFSSDPIELARPVEPLPQVQTSTDQAGNTLIMSIRQMGNITSSSYDQTADDHLGLSSYWIGGILSDSYLSEPAEEGWLENLNRILNTRYFITVAPLSYEAPLLKENHYEGGTATAIVSLYDRETKSVRCRFTVDGQARGRVSAEAENEYRLKDNLTYQINEAVRLDLYSKAYKGLEERIGGGTYQ